MRGETLVAAKPAIATRLEGERQGLQQTNSHGEGTFHTRAAFRLTFFQAAFSIFGITDYCYCSRTQARISSDRCWLPKKCNQAALNAWTHPISNLSRAFDALPPLVPLNPRTRQAVLLDNLHLNLPFRPDLRSNRCIWPTDVQSSTCSDLQ